jgi:starch-binding outer membrane protein, SusD/RagB family
MKRTYIVPILAGASLLFSTASCSFFDIQEVTDPNNPSLESVSNNPSLAEVNALGTGTEASMRLGFANNGPYNNVMGSLGREIVVLASNEPRWYSELLGTGAQLDNSAFYTSSYADFARPRRAAQVFRESAQTASLLSAEQKKGIDGFTRTVEAFAKLHMLNYMGTQGIRVDVSNPSAPGPFVSYDASLADIKSLLDQGAADLDAAGATFAFPLSAGYAAGTAGQAFNTPATYKQFNRALAARVAAYQKDWAGVLSALDQSFINESPVGSNGNGNITDITKGLNFGPRIVYNPANNSDASNPYFQSLNSTIATLVTVQNRFVTEAEPNDARLGKISKRTAPRVLSGINGEYEPRVYLANTAPMPLVRNEELLLLAAEANIQLNRLPRAVELLNIIRTKSGNLALYSGAVTTAALTDEMLKQRRYSLWWEGHRLIDIRRYDRLSTLPLDAANHKVYANMPKTAAELAWDLR